MTDEGSFADKGKLSVHPDEGVAPVPDGLFSVGGDLRCLIKASVRREKQRTIRTKALCLCRMVFFLSGGGKGSLLPEKHEKRADKFSKTKLWGKVK